MARVREWEDNLIAWHCGKLRISVRVRGIITIKADILYHIVFRIYA